MSAWRHLLGLCCLLRGGASGETGAISDAESIVQTTVHASEGVSQQLTTFNMMAEAMGTRVLSKLARSTPHKHLKSGEEASSTQGGGAAPKKQKRKHGGGLFGGSKAKASALTELAAGCTERDFWALNAHVKGLATRFGPRIQAAMKTNDTEDIKDAIEEFMPSQCEMKQIVSMVGVNWDNLEICIVKATNVSSECMRCPVNFLQKVVGKSMLEVPFNCAPRCSQVGVAALKCGDGSAECDSATMEKMAPCLDCVSPRLLDLARCSGFPHVSQTEAKLGKLRKAVESASVDMIDNILKEEMEEGRDELEHLATGGGTAMAKVLALSVSAVFD